MIYSQTVFRLEYSLTVYVTVYLVLELSKTNTPAWPREYTHTHTHTIKP